MKALVIVDMLDDFVTGALANPHAEAIVEPLGRLLEHARNDDQWVVVFSNDAHDESDPELRVWGEHALAGSPGAQVIAALEPRPGAAEIVSPKRAYGAFDGTGLDGQLKALGVDEVVLAGQHTHICIRHSAYGALIHGYGVTVARDAVCTFEGIDADAALEYLVMAYGADVTDVEALTRRVASAHAYVSPGGRAS
jgi:nicotinamidase-related amidase